MFSWCKFKHTNNNTIELILCQWTELQKQFTCYQLKELTSKSALSRTISLSASWRRSSRAASDWPATWAEPSPDSALRSWLTRSSNMDARSLSWPSSICSTWICTRFQTHAIVWKWRANKIVLWSEDVMFLWLRNNHWLHKEPSKD